MPLSEPTENVDILLYSVNGTGLGHLTRLMAIGRWLRKLINGRDLGARAYFLSCSDADFLLAQQGFASFKLPSRNALKRASTTGRDSLAMIRRYAAAALEQIDPDILVVDSFPTGTYDELLPVLGSERLTKVFVFREQRPEYMARIPYKRLLANYDLVVVPHAAGSFELPELPQPGPRVAWSGHVVFGEKNELWDRGKVYDKLGISPGKTVIYTAAGGGGDRESQQTLELVTRVASRVPDVHLVVGAGPLNRGTPLAGENLTWTTFYPISRMFRGFDLAISSSGYNTVHELLFFGLPSILYAQERAADDQLARARQVGAAGAALALDRLEPRALEAALGRLLDPELRAGLRRAAQRLVPDNGARRAAEAILEVALPKMESQGRLTPAARRRDAVEMVGG